MRTITPKPFNVYEFDELSDEAKQKAIKGQRDFEMETENPWGGEWRNTMHKIEELFDIEVDFDSYNRHSISWRKWWNKDYGEESLALTGNRALSFLWNNYGRDICPGKYYGKLVPCPKSKEHPVGLRHVKRYSKCTPESFNCPLTGVCYDNDALEPLWRFLEGKDDDPKTDSPCSKFFSGFKTHIFKCRTVKDIIENCVDSLCDAWEREEEYRLSDEGLIESIKGNGYEYYDDGTLYAGIEHGEVA